MVLKRGHCGKLIGSAWEVLKHGAGEEQLERSCEK